MNATDGDEAACEFDAIMADFQRRSGAKEDGCLLPFADDLFRFAAQHGFVTGALVIHDTGTEWGRQPKEAVFSFPGGERRSQEARVWFRTLLARLAEKVDETLRGEPLINAHSDEEQEPFCTGEDIAAEYERLQLAPVMSGDTEADIQARRERVIRNFDISPLYRQRAKEWMVSFISIAGQVDERTGFLVSPYGFAVTVDYPTEAGHAVPLYVETWNNVRGQKAYEFTIRRLEPGEERPIDRLSLHEWIAAQQKAAV